ncbi:hypothetical protein WJX77_006488 [Trebouxia sp. C0004]
MGVWSQVSGTVGWAAKKGKAAACSTGAAVSWVAAPALTKVKKNSRDIAVVTTGTVAANAAVLPALSCVGFTAAGPAAGSIAAGWMSLYGGAVSAGSWYALAQSVAMGGTAVGFAIPASAVAVSYLGGKAIYSRCKAATPQPEEDARAKSGE